MAGKGITELFADFSFRVDLKGLRKFENVLGDVEKRLNGVSRSISQSESKLARQIKTQRKSNDQQKKTVTGLTAIEKRLDKNSGALQQVRKDYQRVNDARHSGDMSVERSKRLLGELAQKYRQLQYERTHSGANKAVRDFEQLSKRFDRNSARLNELRGAYYRVNSARREGHLGMERSSRLLNKLQSDYRSLQGRINGAAVAQDRFTGSSLTRTPKAASGSAGGMAMLGRFSVGGLAGIGAALGVGMAKDRVQRSSKGYQNWQSSGNALTAVTGSRETGERDRQFVVGESVRIGTDLSSALENYTKLAASTQNADYTKQLFTAIQERGTVLGVDSATMSNAVRALGQMASKGQVMSEELKGQLAEAIPGAVGDAARALGYVNKDGTANVQKLQDELQKGNVQATRLLPRLAALWSQQSREGGALQQATQSTRAKENRLTTQRTLSNIVLNESGLDKGYSRILTELRETTAEAGPALKALGDAFGSIADGAIIPAIDRMGKLANTIGTFYLANKEAIKSVLGTINQLYTPVQDMMEVWDSWLTATKNIFALWKSNASLGDKIFGTLTNAIHPVVTSVQQLYDNLSALIEKVTGFNPATKIKSIYQDTKSWLGFDANDTNVQLTAQKYMGIDAGVQLPALDTLDRMGRESITNSYMNQQDDNRTSNTDNSTHHYDHSVRHTIDGVTFNISGEGMNAKEVGWEIENRLQGVFASASLNEPETER
ncbi:tape measure protein [Kushneria phyllosphaerae]|uniref:Chromosome partition protein Smc n=1 Tax=Kushneria phyllosphaerae TaxID=2100822 RepID=A0A2R8CIF3_9GAMM|nr:tape measure protein [Kushneria phyllosphaerae]SPJ32698.1 Chromosome partition protein Smc [Kushneria phyllosphaerae]